MKKSSLIKIIAAVAIFAFIGGYILIRGFAASTLVGDINGDNAVNLTDLSILLSNYGQAGTSADLNQDGVVNLSDLSILLTNYGKAATSPSGQDMPNSQVTSGGHTWTPVFAEDFLVNAPLGSWANACTYSTIMYTGSTGTQWRSYPQCYKDTFQKRYYRPDQVLSVHDGTLDYYLHTVDGHPAGANPTPVLPGGTEYQTYGRYTARMRQTTNSISDYYMAWLLWPQNDSDYQCAESDFPEGSMGGTSFSSFSHYGCSGAQDSSTANNIDKTQWHTYTQEWLPGRRNYYVDDKLIGTSTNQVWSSPQRWQLQTETNTNCENTTNGCVQSGNLLVDWVVVYKY